MAGKHSNFPVTLSAIPGCQYTPGILPKAFTLPMKSGDAVPNFSRFPGVYCGTSSQVAGKHSNFPVTLPAIPGYANGVMRRDDDVMIPPLRDEWLAYYFVMNGWRTTATTWSCVFSANV